MNKFNYLKLNKAKKIRYLKYTQKNATYIVFLHGFMSDLEGKKPKTFLNFAKKNNLMVFEDAAQALGSKFKNKHIINFSDAATFSLHPLKNLNVWGDGGFILTNNSALAKKLYLIRNHGLKNRNNCD